MKTKFNKLDEIDKTNPFKVPVNYFQNFNKEVMSRLPEREFTPPVVVSMWDRVKPWIYLAAMFIGLYITINFLVNKSDSSTSDEPIVTQQSQQKITNTENYWSTVHITEEEFYGYLEEQLIDESYFDLMYDQYYIN